MRSTTMPLALAMRAWTLTSQNPIRETVCRSCSSSGCRSGQRCPFRDAGPFLSPCGVEFESLDLFDRSLVSAPSLARLCPCQSFHEAQVALRQKQRVLSPQIDDLDEGLVLDR